MIHFVHFFAGVLFVNGIPHFVQGISGNRFQSPFAKPPGVGESSPVVNVLWGLFNLLAGGFLNALAGGAGNGTAAFLSGGALSAVLLALHFGRVRGNNDSS